MIKSSMLGLLGLSTVLALLALPTRPVAADKQHSDVWVAKGQKLYKQYCATCDGLEGAGDGPAAAALKEPPADLTRIQKPGEKFPFDAVRVVIDGEKAVTAHGSREMPVWGAVLRRTRGDLGQADIEALTKYVQSIQRAKA
ncbi:MAG TPA: c-type cytochrome [Blastocatellia bacterium]|nr:c-type cytochrome [Blastocatellia bacterium]